jgi:hypothetical protein
MKSTRTLILRPKHALWLVAALIGSTWYFADPQARRGPVDSLASQPDPKLPSGHSAAPPEGPLVVAFKPGKG